MVVIGCDSADWVLAATPLTRPGPGEGDLDDLGGDCGLLYGGGLLTAAKPEPWVLETFGKFDVAVLAASASSVSAIPQPWRSASNKVTYEDRGMEHQS